MPLRDSLIDGELVIDVDPRTQQVRSLLTSRELSLTSPFQHKLRFLAFDCLVIDGQNVMKRPLDKRYGVRCYNNDSGLRVTRHLHLFSAIEGMAFEALFENVNGSSTRSGVPTL